METHLSFQGENGIYAEAVHTLELGGWMELKQAVPLPQFPWWPGRSQFLLFSLDHLQSLSVFLNFYLFMIKKPLQK